MFGYKFFGWTDSLMWLMNLKYFNVIILIEAIIEKNYAILP